MRRFYVSVTIKAGRNGYSSVILCRLADFRVYLSGFFLSKARVRIYSLRLKRATKFVIQMELRGNNSFLNEILIDARVFLDMVFEMRVKLSNASHVVVLVNKYRFAVKLYIRLTF